MPDLPVPAADLDAIRAREEVATLGPWDYRPPRSVDGTIHSVADTHGVILRMEDTGYSERSSWAQRQRDAQFIAHAREDIPALLAELDRLRVENEELQRARDEAVRELHGAQLVVGALVWTMDGKIVVSDLALLYSYELTRFRQFDPPAEVFLASLAPEEKKPQ